MKRYKNIIFDLGGVVVERDPNKCTKEFMQFFEYIHYDPMPTFWSDYDLGVVTLEYVKRELAEYRGVSLELCDEYVDRTITMQEEVLPTKELIIALKRAGYRLYILSNMALEYINHIRTLDVYNYFDGEVISSEERCIKPDVQIYKILLDKYDIDPHESLFIDDRKANVVSAQSLGIDVVHFNSASPQCSCKEISDILL